jgi:hypothetical protein
MAHTRPQADSTELLDAHVSPLPAGRRHRLPPLSGRWTARLHPIRLERELASGIASWRSPAHAALARRLTNQRSRRSLAQSLERLLRDAEAPSPVLHTVVVRPSRGQVLEARPLLTGLAVRLRADGPIDARGAAQLKRLLCDGTSPCYVDAAPGTLSARLRVIDQWLDAPA